MLQARAKRYFGEATAGRGPVQVMAGGIITGKTVVITGASRGIGLEVSPSRAEPTHITDSGSPLNYNPLYYSCPRRIELMS